MSYSFEDIISIIKDARVNFLKHVDGLTEEQFVWKSYPEAKNVVETLAHLITDDRMALDALKTGKEPDYDNAQVAERDPQKLLALLAASHDALAAYLTETYSEAPVDTLVSAWGFEMKLGRAAAYLSAEDYYHAGQVGYIRLATDPTWDYYAAIYG